MDIKKFSDGIKKTGFVLENKVAQVLNNHGWSVISNKYYEDDFEEKIREIDLIAYKVSRVQDFDVYTCLIISCKKNESNTWAFLCRDINLKDPNSDWWPLHTWSNEPSIKHMLAGDGKAKEYYKAIDKLDVKNVLRDPKVEVFAFQEMDSSSGSPKNDKAIYESITSLIKAQSYEMGVLPERKTAPSAYQFNLLSVVDANMVRLQFDEDEIVASSTSDEHFVSRYIVKKRQSFSRIRFLKANRFERDLEDYNQLHIANSNWFDKICNEFYDEIEKDYFRLKVYLDKFVKEIRWYVFHRIYRDLNKEVDFKNLSFAWDANKKSLLLTLDEGNDVLETLNNDPEIQDRVAKALKKIYRYAGKFQFDGDMPF